jgi:sulfur-carrier protein
VEKPLITDYSLFTIHYSLLQGVTEMALNVIIPTALRKFADNSDSVEIEASTVGEVLDRLDDRFPGFRARLCEENGELRRFINIFIDGEDIRFLENLKTTIPADAEVSIVPAIAGGCA